MSDQLRSHSKRYPFPKIDWTSDDWAGDDKEKVLRWYMEAHGTGDTSQARFAPFMLEYNPLGFRLYRRHVQYHGGGAPGALLFIHYYAAVGLGDNCLYQMVSARQQGLTKGQVLEALAFAWLTAGPTMNAAAEKTSSFLFGWEDDGKPSTYQWPDGWAPDPDAMRSGMDLSTDEMSADDLQALRGWHERVEGEVPRYVDAWARLQPKAYKTNRIRYERGFGMTLPVQIFPLFTLHLATFRVWPRAVRQALLQARTFGVRRPEALGAMESAFTCGGEPMMAGVLTDEVLDALEALPDQSP